jgi:hypothetical protein
MRNILTALGIGMLLTLLFGCSDLPPTINAPVDHANIDTPLKTPKKPLKSCWPKSHFCLS